MRSFIDIVMLLRRINFKALFVPILYIIPLAFLLWFIFSFGINVPVWDDWSLVYLFKAVSQKNVSFSNFFAQHNEHRILVPRLIFVVLAFISKWNLKVEMYFSVLLEIITFYFIYKLAQYTPLQQNTRIFHLFNVTTCFYIFAIWQSDNWLWGFQFQWHLVNTCFVIAIFWLTVPQKLSHNLKLSGAALCCFIASFSMIHGLLSWVAAIPSVFALKGTKKQRFLRILFWLILFVITCAIYNRGYHNLGRNYIFLFENPGQGLKFFITVVGLGLPFSSDKLLLNPLLNGVLILVIFLLFNIYFIQNYRSKLIRDAVPWLSIAWFPILFALVTTIGRASTGAATGSRFSTVSLLLIISCLQMWRLLICHKSSWFPKTAAYRFLGSYVMVGFLISLWFIGSANTISALKNNVERFLETPSLTNKMRGKTCLEIINYLDKSFDVSLDLSTGYFPKNCLHYISAWKLRDAAITLEELDFRDFPNQVKFNSEPIDVYGQIESPSPTNQVITLSRDNSLKLKGRVNSLKSRQSPAVVLLSYNDQKLFFADAAVKNQAEWQDQVSLQSLPLGQNIIKAWIYDRQANQFVKLKGEVELNIVEK